VEDRTHRRLELPRRPRTRPAAFHLDPSEARTAGKDADGARTRGPERKRRDVCARVLVHATRSEVGDPVRHQRSQEIDRLAFRPPERYLERRHDPNRYPSDECSRLAWRVAGEPRSRPMSGKRTTVRERAIVERARSAALRRRSLELRAEASALSAALVTIIGD